MERLMGFVDEEEVRDMKNCSSLIIYSPRKRRLMGVWHCSERGVHDCSYGRYFFRTVRVTSPALSNFLRSGRC